MSSRTKRLVLVAVTMMYIMAVFAVCLVGCGGDSGGADGEEQQAVPADEKAMMAKGYEMGAENAKSKKAGGMGGGTGSPSGN